MFKNWVIVSLAFMPYLGWSQTGPAGIGASDGSSTLELWLDIDKGITTTNNTGSGGSATDVTNWADQSGNGLNMTGAGTAVPEFITSFVNGHGAMQFVQSNFERLNLSNTITSITASDNRTFLYVFKFTGNLNNCEIMGPSSGESVDYGTFTVTNDRLRLRNGANNAYSAINSVTQDAWHVGTLSKNGTAVNAWNDNTNILNTTGTFLDWAVSNAYDLGAANFSGRSFQGEIAELIIYSTSINTAQRIILNNYLAAKYNITLSASDIYDEDNAGSNFDYEVAGIGRTDASNIQSDSRGTGIVRILNATDLGNDEFFIWGHNNGALLANETSDVPAGVAARFARVWRVSEASSAGAAVDVGSIDIRFDLSNLGTVVITDLRLLVDSDNDGVFSDETPITGATSLGSNIYAFTGVSAIANNMRFTLGTSNATQTPLPVELVSFTVSPLEQERKVEVKWTTATERDNDYFTVERSADGYIFQEVERVQGANTTNTKQSYSILDAMPFTGLSYYRLKQTDLDGNYEYLGIRAATLNAKEQIVISPNPAQDLKFTIHVTNPGEHPVYVKVMDTSGEELYARQYGVNEIQNNEVTIDLPATTPGMYILQVILDDSVYTEKLFIK
ncbi:T9SS type A sorting domain-containing protein [Ohtaekwangia koreensis]|uniref:Por secretion system C-terminal sorting domain-containing protein n=1 Tax=Ohtaekwangia koreensis TaxID=688867 RepID=A0A1T5MBK3_9BACT|nr:T9SS type A sorting domain-containing protein [Ohtaekwangia koreensis]SKC85616.1 Por secretion system C-terminal sorting domain-containing protein [Ohtaekwangia koreensis]